MINLYQLGFFNSNYYRSYFEHDILQTYGLKEAI